MNIKDKLLDIADLLVYGILALLMYYRALVTNGNIVTKIVFAVLGTVFMAICIMLGYQKSLYKKALYQLDYKVDVEKANDYYEKLLKYDFLKTYGKQRGFFDLMIMLALNEMEKVRWIIEMNEKHFEANADMKMIKEYYLLRAYTYEGNKEEAGRCYRELVKLFDAGSSSELVDKDIVEALYLLSEGKNVEASEAFIEITNKDLCPKDRKWILETIIRIVSSSKRKTYTKQLEDLMNSVGKDNK